jgi:hypothetical protein
MRTSFLKESTSESNSYSSFRHGILKPVLAATSVSVSFIASGCGAGAVSRPVSRPEAAAPSYEARQVEKLIRTESADMSHLIAIAKGASKVRKFNGGKELIYNLGKKGSYAFNTNKTKLVPDEGPSKYEMLSTSIDGKSGVETSTLEFIETDGNDVPAGMASTDKWQIRTFGSSPADASNLEAEFAACPAYNGLPYGLSESRAKHFLEIGANMLLSAERHEPAEPVFPLTYTKPPFSVPATSGNPTGC